MLLHCGSILFWFEWLNCFIHSEAIDSDKVSIQKTIQKEKVLTGHDLVLSGQILGNNSRKLVEQGNRALQLVLYWRMGAAQAIVNWRTNKTCPEPPKWRVRSCRVGSLLPMCVLLGSLWHLLQKRQYITSCGIVSNRRAELSESYHLQEGRLCVSQMIYAQQNNKSIFP